MRRNWSNYRYIEIIQTWTTNMLEINMQKNKIAKRQYWRSSPFRSKIKCSAFIESSQPDSPNPSPAGERVPPPLIWGGDAFACVRRGGEVPIPTRGQTLWYSRLICTLWCRLSIGRCVEKGSELHFLIYTITLPLPFLSPAFQLTSAKTQWVRSWEIRILSLVISLPLGLVQWQKRKSNFPHIQYKKIQNEAVAKSYMTITAF